MLAPGIRLYSRQRRAPVDVVAVEHREVHELLEAWARSGVERRKRQTCGSVEKRSFRGGRDATPASTAPDAVNNLWERVERVVVALEREHSWTVVRYYVRKWPVWLICRDLGLRFESFEGWIYSCREMVRQRL
jgi:hypothetical protein